MGRQYNRVYDLTIVPPDGLARVVKDLRITFEITKSILSYPNVARIVIYNPNEETLSALQQRYTSVLLNAGYEGDVRLLFKGEVRNVFQNKKGRDRLLTIYSGDGEQSWQNASFNKTFSENLSVQSAIEEVLETFSDINIGVLQGLPNIKDKLRGQTLSGSSKDIMNTFAEEYGFSWSIQDGEIVIVPDEQALEGDEAVLINNATGMIGSPTVTEIGVDVTTLLNPRLLPNRAFKIESVNAEVAIGNLFFRDIKRTSGEGLYKVQEVSFTGDSRQGDWLSSVKGRIL